MLNILRISNEVVVRKVLRETNHEASVIDQNGQLIAKSFSFANTTSGAEGLLNYISQCNTEKDIVVIGMEATGHYWMSLYCFLNDAGFQVNVINPIQCDTIRNLFLRETKNDAKDSFLIAETIRIGRIARRRWPMRNKPYVPNC